jgi:DUF971 family protein
VPLEKKSDCYPTEIKLHKKSRQLAISFSDGCQFNLAAEYLRVYSPSAEVTGHGSNSAILVTGKENINIEQIEPIGRYAVRLIFDDGHATGLYTWPILYELGSEFDNKWAQYLARLKEAGHTRL